MLIANTHLYHVIQSSYAFVLVEKYGIHVLTSNEKSIIPPADIYLKQYDSNDYKFYKHVENPFFNINNYSECPDFAGFVKVMLHVNWEKVKYVKVEYDAEFCDLYIGDYRYQSIGGQLFCELSSISCEKEDIYFIIGSGLGNVLKDDFSEYNYIGPCKLISICICEDEDEYNTNA